MGMNSRNKNNMYDIRPDEIRTEKMNSKQMASIDNILNEDFDVQLGDSGRPSINQNDPYD